MTARRSGMRVAVVFAAALTLLPETQAGCVLDMATVIFVPPNTFQVLATRLCGPEAARCWERYAVIGDVTVPQGTTCETQSTMGGRPSLKP